MKSKEKRTVLLGELIEPNRNICYGIVQPGFHNPKGVPIVRVNNIQNGQIDTRDIMRVNEDIEKKYPRSRLRGGEVLLTLVGRVGDSAVVTDDLIGYNVARAVAVIPVNQINPYWVHYCFRDKIIQDMILSLCNTTVQTTFNLKDLATIPISVFSDESMKIIIHILQTFDKQIKNLGLINSILEKIIQIIFKSWFIDFDEQTEFEDSELGQIPKGWKVETLENICTVTDYTANGSFAGLKENVTYSYVPDYAILVRQIDFNNNWNGDSVYVDKHSYQFLKKSFLEPGDIMISNIGNLGTTFQVPDLGQPMTGAPNVLIVKTEDFKKEFTYSYLLSNIGKNVIRSIATGSAVPKFNKTDFRNIRLIYPDENSICKFHRITLSIRKLIQKNEKQLKLLQSSKNLLLPKLMLGKIKV